jgi:hypothetical protein
VGPRRLPQLVQRLGRQHLPHPRLVHIRPGWLGPTGSPARPGFGRLAAGAPPPSLPRPSGRPRPRRLAAGAPRLSVPGPSGRPGSGGLPGTTPGPRAPRASSRPRSVVAGPALAGAATRAATGTAARAGGGATATGPVGRGLVGLHEANHAGTGADAHAEPSRHPGAPPDPRPSDLAPDPRPSRTGPPGTRGHPTRPLGAWWPMPAQRVDDGRQGVVVVVVAAAA